MQLVDFSQMVLRALFASLGKYQNTPIEESQVRHLTLNILRSTRKKFFAEFGELVICADHRHTWRRDVFPYYKANRKKSREESEIDWTHLFEIIEKIRGELRDFFPYKFIMADGAEADDIIGVLCHEHGTRGLATGEPIVIHSSDKDFVQLQVYANVQQWDPTNKKWIRDADPEGFRIEHILRGDAGDGVPNVLTADKALVLGERQARLTSKRLALLRESTDNMDSLTLSRYHRNKMLIDLAETPQSIREEILEQYERPVNSRKGLINYFIAHRLKNLMTDIQDF